jgi:uncharacterized repeat protein (TIGR01451 family)
MRCGIAVTIHNALGKQYIESIQTRGVLERIQEMFKKLSAIAAGVVLVPILAHATPAFASTAGQLSSGDVYRVKNLTTNGAFTNSATATCGDTVEFRVAVYNVGPDTINNVKVAMSLPSSSSTAHHSTVTMSAANTNGQIVSDGATVTSSKATSLKYISGTAQLLNASNGSVVSSLSGNLVNGSVTLSSIAAYLSNERAVQFRAKVSCAAPTPAPTTPKPPVTAPKPPVTTPTTPTTPTPTPPPTVPASPATPTYSCTMQAVAVADKVRTGKVTAFTTDQTNGATFQNAALEWGDGAAADGAAVIAGQSHVYAQNGTYTVTATAHFMVGGADQVATCMQEITIATVAVPVTAPVTTPVDTTPVTPVAAEALPKTGAGNTIGLFVAVTVAGMIGHRLYLSRKLARR